MPFILGILAILGGYIIRALFVIGTSFLAKSVLTAVIMLVLSYVAVTKFEAVDLVIDMITDMVGASPSAGYAVNFAGIGGLLTALRIEDCIFVYLSAYVSAYLINLFSAAVKIARTTLPA